MTDKSKQLILLKKRLKFFESQLKTNGVCARYANSNILRTKQHIIDIRKLAGEKKNV